MARTRRIQVFVNDEEYGVLKAVTPEDEAIGRTLRRLALDRARWLAGHGKKQRGTARSQSVNYGAESQESHYADGDTWLDTSDSQV